MNGRWIDQFPPIREYDLELDEDIYELKMADAAAAQAAADRAEESARQAEEIADALREEIPTKVSELENDSNYAVDANYVHTDNNFTTSEKNKLEGIAAGAEVNVNADWNAVSGDAAILNKPTKVSDFQNDVGYITGYTETDPTVPAWAKASTKPSYTASEVGAPTVQEMNTAINNAIGSVNSFDVAVVQTLPSENINTHTIYLVPKTGETNDVYDEYIYINNAWEMVGNTQIDLSDYALKSEIPEVPVDDVQIDGTSIINNGVANIPVASSNNYGVVKIGNGLKQENNTLCIEQATDAMVKNGTNTNYSITPAKEHRAVFYGLAKAAGDSTQSASSNAVGTYTDEAKTAIQTMLNVPDKSDITVDDVQIDGTSIVSNGVANIPYASQANGGVVKIIENGSGGFQIQSGYLLIKAAELYSVKAGSVTTLAPIVPRLQDMATFYGLAKAAGADEKDSSLPLGQYTENAKLAIQSMLGVTDSINNATSMLATVETTTTASKAYAVGDLLIYNGLLYKVTSAITLGSTIIPDGNVEQTTVEQELAVANNDVTDVQVNSTSIVSNGIANIDSVMVPGTGVGSARTRDYEYNGDSYTNKANGRGSFAEGTQTYALGTNAHAEGRTTLALGSTSHAEGGFSVATNQVAHVEGFSRAAGANYSHVEGWGANLNGTISGSANAITYTINDNSIDVTKIKIRDLVYLYEFGKVALIASVDRINNSITLDRTFGDELNNAYIVIYKSYTYGPSSHAEGYSTITLGAYSHAEGSESITKGYNSHAEGSNGKALGNVSHAEGTYTVAAGDYSHTENNHTFALGRNAHAQNGGESLSLEISGDDNATTYTYSGNGDPSVGDYIASYENYARITSVDTEHKQFTVDNSLVYYLNNEERYIYRSGAFGANSHVEGKSTTALGTEQHVQGKYNTLDNQGTYADIVGNGTTHTNRSNAYALTWTGDGHYAGNVYVGANADSTGGTKVATVDDIPEVPVQDVQINGTSILNSGVANIPVASTTGYGAVKLSGASSGINSNNNGLYINRAVSNSIKAGTDGYRPITPIEQHNSVFYGLAKAAGDTTQAQSENAVGTYTENAKSAIQTMLGIDPASIAAQVEIPLVETISGTTPTITGEPNVRYMCGEVSTITITPPASGSIDVIFDSGSTAAVLTVSSTVRWPEWFDATELETDRTYEILITDGVYGSVMSWAI